MNKDVLISIRGLHFDVSEQPEDLEVFQPGQYYMRGGLHYIIYEEPVEGTDYTTKNMIKFDENSMTLTKKGIVNATMLFDKNNKNLTNYNTPYGSITIGIDTQSINVYKGSDEIRLNIRYRLDVNYEFLSECNIDIIARNAESTTI